MKILMSLILSLTLSNAYAWGETYSLKGEAGSYAGTESNAMTWDHGSAHANSGAQNTSWAKASYNNAMIDTKAMTNGSAWGSSSNMGHTSSDQNGFGKAWGSFQMRGMR